MRLVIPVCVAVCALAAGSHAAYAQSATAVQPLTEADALRRLMASDVRIRAIRARTEAVRATQAERLQWPNPTVSFARESVASVDDNFLVGHQELPISGRRGHLGTAGRLAVDAAAAEAMFEIRQIQADVRRSFTALLAAQEHEAVLTRATSDLRQYLEVLRAREQAGEGSRYDRLRGERALIELEADRAASAVARARAQAELAAVLGPDVTPDTLVAVGDLGQPVAVPPVAGLIDRALSLRADYRASALAINQFEAEREAAEALRVPTPTLGYGLKRSGVGDTMHNGYQFSFDVAVPLFSRGQSAAALARAQAARAEAQAAFLRLRIATDVHVGHTVLTMQQERAARYQQAVTDAAEPLVAIARVAYEEGELGILELLDAARQLLDARLRVIEMHTAARLAAIELDRAIGLEIRP